MSFKRPPPGFRFRPFVFAPSPHPGHFFHHHGFLSWGTGFIGVPYPYYETVVSTNQLAYEDGSGYPPSNGIAPSPSAMRSPGQLAPFDPTPLEVVGRMLALANIKPRDVVYDLGAGDGRFVITAAKKYGVRAVGFEIDPGMVKLARENVRREGVAKLVEIRQQDFMTADLSPATVVTLYLSYDGNLAVRPRLMRQLRPGARVVSNTFDMGDWQPKIVETYRDAAGDTHMLYYWEIGEAQVYSYNRQ
jgi:precorrin-6B methylase 2